MATLQFHHSALTTTTAAASSRPTPGLVPRVCSSHLATLTRSSQHFVPAQVAAAPSTRSRHALAQASASQSSAPTAEPTVEQLMIKKPICFRDNQDIKEAVKTMLDKNISGAPVVDSSGRLVGVLSESDVIWKGAGTPLDHYLIPPTYISILDAVIQLRDNKQISDESAKILSRTVEQAMSKDVVSIAPTASLTSAAQLMVSKKINRLPVIVDGKVVGLLTRHDILKGIYETKTFM